MQSHAASHNNVACCWGFLANNVESVCMNLKRFKLYATSADIVVFPCKRTQHVGPNNVVCCWPTMLRPFAWVLRYRDPKLCLRETGYKHDLKFALLTW